MTTSTSTPAAPLAPAALLLQVDAFLWKLAHRAARRHPAMNAEELHGDMAVLLLRYARKYDGTKGAPSTWAFTVARTAADVAYNAARKRDRFAADGSDYLAGVQARDQPAAPEPDAGAALAEHLRLIPRREADVVARLYGLNGRAAESLSQIAKTARVTRERIRQIEAKALYRLRVRLSAHAPDYATGPAA